MTQPCIVLEAAVDKSSSSSSSSKDEDFVSKVISPKAKRNLHRRQIIDTPPSHLESKLPATNNKNPESRIVCDLNTQIMIQQNVIQELCNKLAIIRDVSNNSR